MTEPLKTSEEMADFLRVKELTVRRWACAGRIPCVRMTKKVVRFRESDVMAALEGKDSDGE